MRKTRTALQIAARSLLLAAAIYGILAAPGFLTDQASTVPITMAERTAR